MRKLIPFLTVVLFAGAFFAVPVEAGAAPKKVTLYLHGVYPLGEIDGVDWIANGTPPMAMSKDSQRSRSHDPWSSASRV